MFLHMFPRRLNKLPFRPRNQEMTAFVKFALAFFFITLLALNNSGFPSFTLDRIIQLTSFVFCFFQIRNHIVIALN